MYRCYLSRNRDLADHCTQFLKRTVQLVKLSGYAIAMTELEVEMDYLRSAGRKPVCLWAGKGAAMTLDWGSAEGVPLPILNVQYNCTYPGLI
jgi:hypothetical protein